MIPDKRRCLEILKDNGTPENIVKHSIAVAKVAEDIVDKLSKKGVKVNKELVIASALLHDIGIGGKDHATRGAKTVKELGFYDVAKVIETHSLNEFGDKKFDPKTIEEKIIFYVDKIVEEDKKVGVENRFKGFKERHGKHPDADNAYEFTKKIERELNNLMSPRLVLFDIDGTLIDGSAKEHKKAFIAAFKQLFGIDTTVEELTERFEGTTDMYVYKKFLKMNGVSEKEIEKNEEKFKKMTAKLFKENFHKDKIDVLPGVNGLIDEIKDFSSLGLITGNVEEIGIFKIKRFGLDKYFKVGGFGSDAVLREDIAKKAIEKSEKFFNKKFDKIVIIGDTTHDIEAGKKNKAVTIGVATGVKDSIDNLKKAKPDFVFNDLNDYKKIAEIILN